VPTEIERLQTVGKDAQEARKHFILRDDQGLLWQHVKNLNGGRVDFVLDNGMYATNYIKSRCVIELEYLFSWI